MSKSHNNSFASRVVGLRYFPASVNSINFNDNMYAWPPNHLPGMQYHTGSTSDALNEYQENNSDYFPNSRIKYWVYDSNYNFYVPLDSNFKQIGPSHLYLPMFPGGVYQPKASNNNTGTGGGFSKGGNESGTGISGWGLFGIWGNVVSVGNNTSDGGGGRSLPGKGDPPPSHVDEFPV